MAVPLASHDATNTIDIINCDNIVYKTCVMGQAYKQVELTKPMTRP